MEWLDGNRIKIVPPRRPKKLTATRFATVLGLNPWSTPFEIWCEITKTQVLTTMLANDKIHPRLAFEHCGLFVDPELAYTQSMLYAEEREAELLKELELTAQHEEDETEDGEEVPEENGEMNEDV